jgi:LPXTG-motif cell wall-anchored protein
MMTRLRHMPLKVGAAVTSSFILATTVGGTASAAPVCDAADYTVNGTLDLDGYLACLAGTGGGTAPAGQLPSTGSDMMRMVALGIGASVVGLGAVLAAKRRAPIDTPADTLV